MHYLFFGTSKTFIGQVHVSFDNLLVPGQVSTFAVLWDKQNFRWTSIFDN